MKKIAYIPNRLDKAQIEPLFNQSGPKERAQPPPTPDGSQNNDSSGRELTKAQLDALLKRLTKITKKQYDIQQQAAHVLHLNKQIQQRRLAGQKVENRLIAKGKERDQKITLKAEEYQKQMKAAFYRDVPQISQKGQKVKQQTIDRRLQQLISNRQKKKEELRNKYDPSFKPIIDTHSDFINDIQNLGDLFNRMNAKQKEAQKRKQSFMKKIIQEERQETTFKPIINQRSIEIAANLPSRAVPGTPFQKHSPSKKSQEAFPFAPKINKNTEKFLSSCERDQDCFRRLYEQAKQLTLKNQSKLKQRERAISFTPCLNEKSLKLASCRKQKQKLLQGGRSSSSLRDETVQLFEEVRVGTETELERNRTYSLRGSKLSRRTWVQESQNHNCNDMKENILKKLRMMN